MFIQKNVLKQNHYTNLLICLLVTLAAVHAAASDAYDQEPILYSNTQPTGPVACLAAELEAGTAALPYDSTTGYLPALLKHLRIPVSSQTLVFSKTSLQRERISPSRPRAIYFNDDTCVGYVNGGEVLEITTSDPNIGTAFYTLDQRPGKPHFVRQTDNCLQCHAGSMTRQVPGLLVRSVKPDMRGLPILRAGTHLTTHESPLAERWGGWYVTGTHGNQKHMGNALWSETADADATPLPNRNALNATDLSGRFDPSAYLRPDSDIVALMVLEHQVEAHNLITRANFGTRQALHDAKIMNEALERPSDHLSESAQSRIRSVCEPLVKYLLFCDEAKLTGEIRGGPDFQKEFQSRGPRNPQGRSLRDFDLKTRLFRHPLSYLIYSDAFEGLPPPAKQYVWMRLHEVLTGNDQSPDFAHLSADDRRTVLQIVRATKKDLPPEWLSD